MSSRDRWKRQERETAAILGGERQPCTGGPHADVTTPLLAIEHKARQKLPTWLTGAVSQAVGSCKDDQTPMVVLTEVSQGRKARRYALLRLEDFVDLYGPLTGEPQ